MKTLLVSSMVCGFFCSSALANQPQELKVDKYYEAIKADTNNQCVWGDEVFTAGAIIEKDGKRYVCNKFKVNSSREVSTDSPAAWREKTQYN